MTKWLVALLVAFYHMWVAASSVSSRSWPKEAMNITIGAGIADGGKM